MIDVLQQIAEDDMADSRARIAAAKAIMEAGLHQEMVGRAEGLKKLAREASGPKTLVNVNVFGELPLADRMKAIQSELAQIPIILPPPKATDVG